MKNQWVKTRLGELVDIHDSRRIPLSSGQRIQRQGQYPYYGAQGIIDYIDDYIFDGKYILIAEDGENLRSRKQPIASFASGKFWVNNHAHIITAKPDRADDYFIKTCLNHANLSAYVTGAAQPKLSQGNLRQIEIDLPDLPTQRKIAGILSTYDDLIENNLRRIKILEEMAQSLYREWFVHFHFPGHESAKLVDSALGKIPEGWEVKKIGDAFEILGGGTPSTSNENYWLDGRIQWYSPRDLTANNSMFIEKSAQQINELGLQKSSAKLFPAYSVMLTSRATIGAIAINTVPSCTNQGFITCLPNSKVPLYFLFQWLHDNVETFILHASGSTFKEISKGVFKGLDFLQPESELVGKYERSVASMADELLNLQRRNQTLRHTRDLLLPKLLSGGG